MREDREEEGKYKRRRERGRRWGRGKERRREE